MKKQSSVILPLTCAAVILGTTTGARAALSFSGDFDPSNWSLTPQSGTVAFSSPAGGTQLDLAGPSGLPVETLSVDTALFNGPGGGGASVAETIRFNWSFNSGDALSATAQIGTMAGTQLLAAAGPGQSASGTFQLVLAPGDQFGFLLSTDSPANKRTPAEFTITGLSISTVPEISTLWVGLGSLGLVCMLAGAGRRGAAIRIGAGAGRAA